MDADPRDQVQRSLDRCATDPSFMDRFYESFLTSSPAIEAKFAKTDWERQMRMMMVSLLHMTDPDQQWSLDDETLRRLAAIHGTHGHAIPAWMFDNWRDSLMAAVARCDPEFTQEIEQAWRASLSKGIAFMKAHQLERAD